MRNDGVLVLDYYFELNKPDSFRYFVMNGLKECILLQTDQEKLDLIRQAKKDLFKEITADIKELESLTKQLEVSLVDDDLKKEIQEEIHKEQELAREFKKKKREQELAKTSSEKNWVDDSKIEEELPKKDAQIKSRIQEIKTRPVSPQVKKDEPHPADLSNFEYTLDKIEKKLAELKKD